MLEQWWQREWVGVAAVLVHSIGQTVFGGGLVTFALLYTFFRLRLPEEAGVMLDRAFRTVSLAMSLGLTLVILGGLLRHQREAGSLFWGLSTAGERLQLLKAGVFLILWVSWGTLEIVILQVIRRGLNEAFPLNSVEYRHARGRLERVLWFQSGLMFVITVLGALSR